MKKILTKLVALCSIGLLMLPACKKDGTLVTSNGGKAGVLTASTTTPSLQKANLTDTTSIIKFSFTAPTYGYSAAVTNTLQIDAPGDNWAKPASATLATKVYSQGYSTADFNALLLKLNLPAGVASQVQVRVAHSLAANVAPIYSNVVSLTVTPFNLTSFLYVVGAFQGWNAATPDSLISVTGNGVYTGIINFTAGNNQFLILPQKNSYNNKYATNDAQGSTSSTVAQNANNNFYAPSVAGQYVVTLNLNSNTISFALANYYSVIGSVTSGGNFSTDADLKYSNDLNGDWIGVVAMTYGTFPGSFKIRENHDWTYSWGVLPTPDGVSLVDANDGNIPVPTAGNYKVTFAIPISAMSASFVPSTTATYTLTKQ